jgi:hypothetical protein
MVQTTSCYFVPWMQGTTTTKKKKKGPILDGFFLVGFKNHLEKIYRWFSENHQ